VFRVKMCLYYKGRFSGVRTTKRRDDTELLYTIPLTLYMQANCFPETLIKTYNTKTRPGPKYILRTIHAVETSDF